MLSKDGRVVVNEAAGMVTVTDTNTVLRRVEKYISSLNSKMGRQVALAVKVWSLELNRNADTGSILRPRLRPVSRASACSVDSLIAPLPVREL